ncbi:unnamed protein product [Trichobilharzia regenti]|nr:unnamed protein product [Trichobilharzia regenti]
MQVPNKGSGIVNLNRDDYVNKLCTILSDEEKFQKSPNQKDKTENIEKELSKSWTKLKQECLITPYMYEQPKPSGSTIHRLYGLPKVQKDDFPLRPVLDMLNSPYHSTAKWLAEILEPVRFNLCKHSLSDTFDFVSCVDEIKVTGKHMISLDIFSLFLTTIIEMHTECAI